MKVSALLLGASLFVTPVFAQQDAAVLPTCNAQFLVVQGYAAECNPVPVVCPDTADCSEPTFSALEELAACESLVPALKAYKTCIKARIDGFKDASE